MLADDELIVINHDESREGEYIRIKVILLGEDLSDINLDVSVFHDVDILTVSEFTILDFSQNTLESATFTQRHLRAVPNKTRLKPSFPVFTENILDKVTLEHFYNDADIVLLVADGNDKFAIKNICTIIEILDKNGILYVKILANKQSFSLCRDKNGDILVSNVLIMEDQKDPTIKAEVDTVRKMEKILNILCQVIDNEINICRMHDYDCSTLNMVQQIAEPQGELYLYTDLSHKLFQEKIKNDMIFCHRLEYASAIWMKISHKENAMSEINAFIEDVEMSIDEDVDLFLFYENVDCHGISATMMLKEEK